jgi:1-acyl-sn-glycerol-3-phosphate acyltransferase
MAGVRWRNSIFRTWARAIAAIIGMKIRVSGPPPQVPFFLVSNHLSYIDIIALASQLDCVFIAKQDVAGWPVMGALCRSIGTIFIDRNHRRDIARVNALIKQMIVQGRSIVLFAEGTSTQGSSVLPFKASLLEPAARAGYPVSYAALGYRTPPGEPPAHLAVCWWGEMTFLDHLFKLLQVSEFEATLTFGSHAIRLSDRRALASSLWQAVVEEFIPVVRLEEKCSTAIVSSMTTFKCSVREQN